MRYILVFLSVSALTIASCTRQTLMKDEYVTLSYKQTFCADPWTNLPDDSLTLVNISAFLNTSNLYVAGLAIKQDTPPDVCNACTCKTGKIIYVTTFNNESLKAEYGKIGFK